MACMYHLCTVYSVMIFGRHSHTCLAVVSWSFVCLHNSKDVDIYARVYGNYFSHRAKGMQTTRNNKAGCISDTDIRGS